MLGSIKTLVVVLIFTLGYLFSEYSLYVYIWSKIKNHTEAVATLVSVAVVLLIYDQGIREEKRNAARILILEIKGAERALREVQRNNYIVNPLTFILPTESWSKFQHYFVKDLTNDQLIEVSEFYNSCATAQKALDRMKNVLPVANEEKIRLTQQALLKFAQEDPASYDKSKIEILEKKFFPEEMFFQPYFDINILSEQIFSKITFIYDKSCGQKLSKIARF